MKVERKEEVSRLSKENIYGQDIETRLACYRDGQIS